MVRLIITDGYFGVLTRIPRSLAGTIACDIIHAGIPISGIVYVGALPHMGDIMGIVCTPLVLSFVPGLCSMDG
jgi:hypothetical protein